MKKIICHAWLLVLLGVFCITSCSRQNHEPLILWTDNAEFASYTELFNASQKDVKVVAVYKTNLADSLPPKKGEKKPDIIAGSWLASGIKRHQFASLNSVFTNGITREMFYRELLEFGKKGKTQYLIPVNFNLGAIVFDINNSDYVENTSTLTFDQLKEYSGKYNSKAKDGTYLRMGFAPQWNPDFLYETLVTQGINFTIENNNIKYNLPELERVCNFLKDWTLDMNTSYNSEKDFAFKYLYTPYNKQVLQQKSLFAYTTSDKLLALSDDQLTNIDFRWFVYTDKSPVQEDITMMGIYKKSKNKSGAKQFIQWFMKSESQEQMIKRRVQMNLDTNTFGIAGGFSSIPYVNEFILPLYYKNLLAKVPSASITMAPYSYPSNWNQIKNEVIIPYLLAQVNNSKNTDSLADYYTDWLSQNKED